MTMRAPFLNRLNPLNFPSYPKRGPVPPFTITATLIAATLIVLVVLFGLTRETGPTGVNVAAAPPAATSPDTTEQGMPSASAPASRPTARSISGQARPVPQERDSIEENTRP
jgi:hypothetical protein